MARNAPGHDGAEGGAPGVRAWPRWVKGAAALSVVCAALALVLATLTLWRGPTEVIVTGFLEISPDTGFLDDLRVYDGLVESEDPLEIAALVRLSEGADMGEILVARGVPQEGLRVGTGGVVWPVRGQGATWGTTPTISSFLGPVALGIGALLLAIAAGFGVEKNRPSKGRR